ncbi:hypothetical protein JMG10_44785, partial [Nostoc ellipsosporum NOK]|nr:hypothetical protein [Nostoc ellipsosporum NOK]
MNKRFISISFKEDEVGNIQLTTVNDLAKAFRGRWPCVTFLSGCYTGQVANKGTVPSMAQALVKAGAGIVLYSRVPQGDELEALLGATAILFCNDRGEGHPQFEELQELSLQIISGAANAQGIETQEAFDNWCIQQRLNDPDYFLPRLNQRLEEIVG